MFNSLKYSPSSERYVDKPVGTVAFCHNALVPRCCRNMFPFYEFVNARHPFLEWTDMLLLCFPRV